MQVESLPPHSAVLILTMEEEPCNRSSPDGMFQERSFGVPSGGSAAGL